jgi:hypothetical protein
MYGSLQTIISTRPTLTRHRFEGRAGRQVSGLNSLAARCLGPARLLVYHRRVLLGDRGWTRSVLGKDALANEWARSPNFPQLQDFSGSGHNHLAQIGSGELIRLSRHAEQFVDQIGVSDHYAPHAANPPSTPNLNDIEEPAAMGGAGRQVAEEMIVPTKLARLRPAARCRKV